MGTHAGRCSTLLIKNLCRDLNYCVDSFALELSIPASTQLRQLSMWHHLRSLEETKSLYTGETLRDDAVDLKETLRLRYFLSALTLDSDNKFSFSFPMPWIEMCLCGLQNLQSCSCRQILIDACHFHPCLACDFTLARLTNYWAMFSLRLPYIFYLRFPILRICIKIAKYPLLRNFEVRVWSHVCRGCLAEPLSQELGKDLDPQDGQLRVTLSYLHPSSASESDFLFGRPFRGRSQKKRRKKTHVIDVGEWNSLQASWDRVLEEGFVATTGVIIKMLLALLH